MGGEVILMMEKGEAKRLHNFVDDLLANKVCEKSDVYYWFKAPDVGCGEHGCWIDFHGRIVQVGYSFSELNDAYALAIACEIRDRFKVKKGGWDSIGYCDDFMSTWTFKSKIWLCMRAMLNGYSGEFQEDIKRYWEWQKIFDDDVEKIFSSIKKHRTVEHNFANYKEKEDIEQQQRDEVLKKIGSITWKEDKGKQEGKDKEIDVKVAVIPEMEDRFVLYPTEGLSLCLYDIKRKSTSYCTEITAEKHILDILRKEIK
jgi:hypothetical protein